jgi:F-type H+-transporting ATPase subunit gamma
MIRYALEFILRRRDAGEEITLVTVGKRGRDFMLRYGLHLEADFTGLGDRVSITDLAPIVRLLIDGYTSGAFKEVHLGYSRFISTIRQQPTIIPMMPIEEEHLIGKDGSVGTVDYIFEPGPEAILNELLPRYMEVQMYEAMLESVASEQSARMVAMRNATDNALDIIDHLTLTYNKARKAAITRELIDITTSAAAIAP